MEVKGEVKMDITPPFPFLLFYLSPPPFGRVGVGILFNSNGSLCLGAGRCCSGTC